MNENENTIYQNSWDTEEQWSDFRPVNTLKYI